MRSTLEYNNTSFSVSQGFLLIFLTFFEKFRYAKYTAFLLVFSFGIFAYLFYFLIKVFKRVAEFEMNFGENY